MKKILLYLLFITASPAFAQNCNIGNESSTGFDNSGDPIYQDYLLGVKFTLSQNGTLNSLNLLGRGTNAQVQLAVYTDNNGVPGNLVIASTTATVTSGIVSIPVTPVPLPAGDYWIMGVYGSDGGHTYSDSEPGNTVYYTSLSFGNQPPSNASGFTSYTGADFTYFMEISCGIADVITVGTANTLKLYPNPANDQLFLTCSSQEFGTAYTITDIAGRRVMNGVLSMQLTVLDISSFAPGIYFFTTAEGKAVKLIKN